MKHFGSKQDFCSIMMDAKKTFFKHLWCKAKILWQNSGCKARLVQTCWCEARLLLTNVGCKWRLLFKHFGAKPDFCSTMMEAKQTFCQIFVVRRKNFIKKIWLQSKILFKHVVGSKTFVDKFGCEGTFSSNILVAKQDFLNILVWSKT